MDAKLWKYIYYDQKPRGEESAKYLETSTTTDDCGVDQLCDQLLNDQLLLHNDLPTHRNLVVVGGAANHTHAHLKSHSHSTYSKLQLGIGDLERTNQTIVKRLIKRLIFYRYFYKFNYFTLLLLFAISLVGLICVLKATNHFESFSSTSHLSTSLPFSAFSPAAFKTNYTFLNQLSTAEQLVNDRLNSFDRILTVETDCASYIGTVEESAFEFLGIPYAKPPLKQLRFRRTVPIWNDSKLCRPKQIRKAKKFGPECFQINPFNRKFHGNEDCLFLNVWTPRLDSSVSEILYLTTTLKVCVLSEHTVFIP